MGGSASQLWLRSKRRALGYQAGLARRRLRGVREKFYSDLWAASGAAIGASVQKRPNGLTQISRDGLATFVDQSDLMLDSAVMLKMMANKALTFELMSAKNIRTPHFVRFDVSQIGTAEDFLLSQTGKPIVVKPADGTGGGRGVITGIHTPQELESAAKHAAGFHSTLLAEEQLTGASYRLMYFKGEYLDAVRRDSPEVTGDGSSTIRQLVKEENAKRLEQRPITALNPLILDQESRNTLRARELSADYVPKVGEDVQVKLAVNENAAAQNHIVRNDVHPELIEAGARLTREFGVAFAGLDVTADDISLPMKKGNVIFNEVNVNPGIHHHYLVSNPEQSADVAKVLLEKMFARETGVVSL